MSQGSATIVNYYTQYESVNPDSPTGLEQAGNCCSQAMLYNQFENMIETPPGLTTTEGVLWSHAVVAHQLLGAVLEFTVTPSTTVTLSIRTCVGAPNASDDPYGPGPNWTAAVADGHIRGWWQYSDATFPVSGTLNVNPNLLTEPDPLKCPVSETQDYTNPSTKITPPELASGAFARQSGDVWGAYAKDTTYDDTAHTYVPSQTYIGNVGLYGVIARYSFNLSNSSTTTQGGAYVKQYSRNNGGLVFGACQIASPSGYPKFEIPMLGGSGSNREGIELTVNSSNASTPVMVAPSGTKTIIVAFAPAGGSALPSNLIVSALRTSQP